MIVDPLLTWLIKGHSVSVYSSGLVHWKMRNTFRKPEMFIQNRVFSGSIQADLPLVKINTSCGKCCRKCFRSQIRLSGFFPWERMKWIKLNKINKDFVVDVFQVSRTEGPGLLLLPDLHGQEGQGRSSHHPAAPRVVLHQQRPEVCRGEFISFFIF